MPDINKKKQTGAEEVNWDLSDLYKAIDDPQLKSDKKKVATLADQFANKYKGNVGQLTAGELREALREYENILELIGKIGSFSHLIWTTNTENAKYGKLMQEANELSSEIKQKLVFFDVEWLKIEEDQARDLIEDEKLSHYKHYLETSRRYKEHVLGEEAEQVLSAKNVTGRSAWNRYFDETLGAARFELDGEGLTEQEMLSKLHESDRELREKAHAGLTKKFKELSRSLTFIFNTLLADKHTNDKLRNYDSWISSRNLANEIDDATVETLIKSVTSQYSLVQRFYNLKRELLGYEELYDYDRYAPLLETRKEVNWKRARDIVIGSYSEFHKEMGSIADKFFEHQWIDAAMKPGKRGGAYSASTVPSVHPYVFMNYDGKLRDVQTLAHELGHGVHQYLSREQGPLQAGTPLTTAETASVFGEMLVFQSLKNQLDDPKEKLALLISKIDDTIATVFRQISMNRFENAMHSKRREDGELTTEEFSELWRQQQENLYGDSVTLTESYDIWWCYIPHFLHTPGYVYAYAFGELLVLALYEEYRQSKNGFADRYIDMLRAGGSEWPEDIVGKVGLDITQPTFWDKGLKVFERMIEEAEALTKQINNVN
ncbi:M3 family oligoendopeptidase [Aliifodinibius sp. S!AR15-10]|uniref:M3 family oligoendopeptidase n=1 Tax=Aliifodinibius sp. S!AR15-10 TaxID=2950437 RepID=UPI00286763B5|nr:M3 family oligoendopeptidase [Aliifodinibius sp. S!AR15-10]MDR8390547.1 M3 family oligoendopeptidase [Aliifodinibius sp. S!AR15-10]